MRSKYRYNAILLPEIDQLLSNDAQVIWNPLQTMLKSKARGITKRGQEMMMAMLRIKPLCWKLLKDTQSSITKMKDLSNTEWAESNKASEKRRDHARRCIWLVKQPNAPVILKLVERGKTSSKDIQQELIREWNKGGNQNRQEKRRVPMIDWKNVPCGIQ